MTFGWDGRIGWGARKDIAFHECGHAVARVLSIGRVGITNANAIRWIQIDRGNPHVSVMVLPHMPGLKEAGERLGIMEGTPWTLEQRLKIFSLGRLIHWIGRTCGFSKSPLARRLKRSLGKSPLTWSGGTISAAMIAS